MSKELEVVAWAISYDGKTPYALWHDGDGPLLDLEVKRLGGSACKLALTGYADAQAELSGFKAYAATLAAERDAANAARIKLVQERFKLAAEATTHLESLGIDGADDGYSIVGLLIGKVESVMAERDALAKELAESKENHRIYYDAWVKSQKACAAAQMELAEIKARSEPVAWRYKMTVGQMRGWAVTTNYATAMTSDEYEPLYTHPAPADKDGKRYRKLRHWMSSNVQEGWEQVERLGAIAAWDNWDNFDAYLDELPVCNVGLCQKADAAIAKEGKKP